MSDRPALVVDASVAIKWVLPETGQAKALDILDLYQNERVDLFAPFLLIVECGNVLWKRENRGELAADAAQRCFEELLVTSPLLLESPVVSRSALRLAIAHRQTVYDCLYLSWALEQGCDLVTADWKFYRAMNPAFPSIRILEEFDCGEKHRFGLDNPWQKS